MEKKILIISLEVYLIFFRCENPYLTAVRQTEDLVLWVELCPPKTLC